MPLPLSMARTQELTEMLQEVLARFGEEQGVVVAISSVQFLAPEVVRQFAYVKNAEAVLLAQKARKYGLGERDYGKEVSVGGRPMKIVACFPRRPKYPFVVQDDRGRRYKISVKSALRNPEVSP